MHFVKTGLLTVAVIIAGTSLIANANEREDALIYIGDCVDIVAQVEGAVNLTPEEKWEIFGGSCAARYADR